MLSPIIDFITIKVIYQPFFNILVLIYNYLPWGQDMGLALIFFTLFINLILLPLTLSGDDTEDERQEMLREIKKLEKSFEGYPLMIQQEKNKLIKSHRKVIWGKLFSYTIYIIYFIVLFRVFKSGLKGEDMYLLYSFIPEPQMPLNLVFFGILDLTQPSQLLNMVSAVLTIPAELLGIMFSDFPPTREDWLTVIFAPFVAYFITYIVPSGQELYFTTSLIFIMVVQLTREVFKIFKNRLAREK